MIFSSVIFLVYFLPIFLLVYFAVDKKYKNAVLLISSILFYSWGAPKFIFAILITTTLDFYLVNTLYNAKTEKSRKLFLVLSLMLNVGMLAYFKYANFFVENFNAVLGAMGFKEVAWVSVILPIGISFYTFESLTYVIDVYRKVHAPLKNFWQYQMYILFFPKLIAGPIVRYHEISDQIEDRSANDNIDNKITGFLRFAIGLGKKVLIANVMAVEADRIFSLPIESISTSMAWIGMLSYTFQIYFDFSGYSDMAIGISRMLGFKIPENFDTPYIAGSITEFWRRWHMTLGNWMRNYLYIPLGGNKVSNKYRLYFNLWLVFLASGFWHGAAWVFIFWGIYHGIFLVLERAFLLKIYERLGKFISVPITFFVVAIGWVFFRSDSMRFSLRFIKRLIVGNSTDIEYTTGHGFILIFIIAIIFSFVLLVPGVKKIQFKFFEIRTVKPLESIVLSMVALTLFFISLATITSSGFNPFIYFRF